MESAPKLTHERMTDCLSYNRETGEFTILDDANVERRKDSAGYNYFIIDGRIYRADALALFYDSFEWPRSIIAHTDGNPSNDAWINLQEAGKKRKQPRKTLTGVKGVYEYKGKYRAAIRQTVLKKVYDSDGELKAYRSQLETKHLGIFDTISEARIAFETAQKEREEEKERLKNEDELNLEIIREREARKEEREKKLETVFATVREQREAERIARLRKERDDELRYREQLKREEEERLEARKRGMAAAEALRLKNAAQYSVANAPENGADS